MSICSFGSYLVYIHGTDADTRDNVASIVNLSSGRHERFIAPPGNERDICSALSVTQVALCRLVLVTASTGSGRWLQTTLRRDNACRISLWHVPTGIALADFPNPY